MISLPDLSLLTQSTGAFTPDLTRSITSQPGVTVRPARCDASGSLVSGSTVLGGDGSMTTSSGSTSVTNNGDGSGTYSDGKVSITNNGDGSGTYSDGRVSIVVNGDGSGTYRDDHLSVVVNGDGSGTYNDSVTGESITLDGKGSGTYSRAGVSITNDGNGSGTYSDGKISITNNGNGTAIVNGSTISAKPVPKAGKVGTFPSIDAAKPVQSCGTVITLEDSVLFDFGSSDLRGQASTTLTNLASRVAESSFFRGPPPTSPRVLLGLMHRTPQATPEEMKGIIMETTEAVSETRSVAVTRVAHAQLEAVWRALMAPAGAQALLGAGGQLGNKGESWKAEDGTYGITRSFHPKEQIRFSWHATEGAPATLVDLRMRAVDDGTELTLVHSNLPEDADLEALRARWETTLEALITAS